MGYSTEGVQWPATTKEKIKSHIQSVSTAMFYEIAHCNDETSDYFAWGCDANSYEYIFASEIEEWISDYSKMPFTFIASCKGMYNTGPGTLSHAFRKGSMEDTVTVGYRQMDLRYECIMYCWGNDNNIENWQNKFFECLSNGYTVKEAFDEANLFVPDCNQNNVPCQGNRKVKRR